MIVRIYQARVVPGRADRLCELIRTKSWPRMQQADGFLGCELYRSTDEPDTVVMVSRWADEAALHKWAGPLWRVRPVANREDYQFLQETDHVQHFELVELE